VRGDGAKLTSTRLIDEADTGYGCRMSRRQPSANQIRAEVLSMVKIGNHLKMNVAHSLRQRTRDFYLGLLKCKPVASTRDDLDLYEFDGGFILGLFFVDPPETLTEVQYLKGMWMELKVDDPAAWKARLQTFGVTAVDFPDPERFFFAAPGGQVFRLAPLDGGL
jgi:hypothetical protein